MRAQCLWPVVVFAAFGISAVEASGTTLDLGSVSTRVVSAASSGQELLVSWTTRGENANAGFLVYGIVDGNWFQLTEGLIPGALDSVGARSYQVRVENPFGEYLSGIGVSGIDLFGKETRHGPFPLGSEVGSGTLGLAPDLPGESRTSTAPARLIENRWGELKTSAGEVFAKVPEDGLYRVSHDALLALNYDLTGVQANRVAVSLRGEPVARYIANLDSRDRWTPASTLEFVGYGPRGDDALYLNALNYRIHQDRRAVLDAGSPMNPPVTPVDLVEYNNSYAYTVPGPDPFYDATFYAYGGQPGTLQRDFDLPGLLGEGKVDFTAYLDALSSFGGTTPDHHLVVEVNGQVVADLWGSGWQHFPVPFSVDVSALRETDNTLRLVAPGDTGFFMDYYCFDKLSGLYSTRLPPPVLTPELEPAPNVAVRSLLRGRADLLILSHPAFLGPDLDAYVASKQAAGWTVKVVDLAQVYAALDESMATPKAIEEFLELADAKVRYSHVLLVGAASYDPRGFLGPDVNFLPSRYVYTDPVTQYTPCDACLVDFDGDQMPEKAVGRWPVRSLEELRSVITKTRQWESWSSRSALTVTDEPTPFDPPFAAQIERITWVLGYLGWSDTTNVDLAEASTVEEARASILEELALGSRLTLYSGHGTPTHWSYQGLLRYTDIPAVQNVGNPTLLLPMACYTVYAESPDANGLSWQWLTAGEHGAAAMVGAATLSEYLDNEALFTEMLRMFLGNDETLGEALLHAKQSLDASYATVIANTNLLGDPTLRPVP